MFSLYITTAGIDDIKRGGSKGEGMEAAAPSEISGPTVPPQKNENPRTATGHKQCWNYQCRLLRAVLADMPRRHASIMHVYEQQFLSATEASLSLARACGTIF